MARSTCVSSSSYGAGSGITVWVAAKHNDLLALTYLPVCSCGNVVEYSELVLCAPRSKRDISFCGIIANWLDVKGLYNPNSWIVIIPINI